MFTVIWFPKKFCCFFNPFWLYQIKLLIHFIKFFFWENFFKFTISRIIKSVLLNEGEIIAGEFTRQHGKTTVIAETDVFLCLFYFSICKKLNLVHYNFFNTGFFTPQQQQAETAFNLVKDFLRECKERGFNFNEDEFNGDTINIYD